MTLTVLLAAAPAWAQRDDALLTAATAAQPGVKRATCPAERRPARQSALSALRGAH